MSLRPRKRGHMKYLDEIGTEYLVDAIKDRGVQVTQNQANDFSILFSDNLTLRIMRIFIDITTNWANMSVTGLAYYTNVVTISSNNFTSIIGANITINSAGNNIPVSASTVITSTTQIRYYLFKTTTNPVDVDATLMIWGIRPS